MAARAVVVDWARAAKLSNPSVLNAFRKRASDASIQNSQLLAAKSTIDFAHYRALLKNSAVVDDAEKLFNGFKAIDYDVSAQLKAIGAFESKAVSYFNSNRKCKWNCYFKWESDGSVITGAIRQGLCR